MADDGDEGVQIVITPRLIRRLRGKPSKEERARQRKVKERTVAAGETSAGDRRRTNGGDEPALIPGPSSSFPFPGGLLPPLARPHGGFQEGREVEGRRKAELVQKRKEELEKELLPVKALLHEAEGLSESLRRSREEEAKIVESAAQDLHAKQYRAPSSPPPCVAERDSCVDCYHTNAKDPLACAKLVDAFVECSRQAQRDFVSRSFGS